MRLRRYRLQPLYSSGVHCDEVAIVTDLVVRWARRKELVFPSGAIYRAWRRVDMRMWSGRHTSGKPAWGRAPYVLSRVESNAVWFVHSKLMADSGGVRPQFFTTITWHAWLELMDQAIR